MAPTKKKSKKKPKKKSNQRTRSTKKKPLKKATRKVRPALAKAARKKKTVSKKPVRPKKGFAGKREVVDSVAFESVGLGPRSGGQSGDLQGLSNRGRASSESVDELLEEGNAFEAEVVKGVEDVVDEEEVHTHEVPEDDVPGEYLDKD